MSLRLENFCRLFADFFFMKCRLFADLYVYQVTTNYFHAHFLQTFCTLSVANDSSSADFMHTFSVFCRPDADLMQTKSVRIAESLHTICTPILYFADLMQT